MRATKYYLTLGPYESYSVISTRPWGKWKVIGGFATTDEAYNAAMGLKEKHPPHNPLRIFKTVDEGCEDFIRVEVFDPTTDLDDVA
jgi:hypothetical protein